MNVLHGLGIQSFCFRGFKQHHEVIEKLKACGVSTIELCAAHVDFTDSSQFDSIINEYVDAGAHIPSIGVQTFRNNESEERLYFEFAKKAGAKFISASFDINTVPESIRTAEKLSDEYDIPLAIHNHGGKHWLGSTEMLRRVFADTSKRIGLCLDTAWALDSREDPIHMVKTFSDRLYGVHIKDFIFNKNREPEDVVVGTGNLNLKMLSDTMEDAGFSGYAVIEYEGDVDNPVPALTECVHKVRETAIGAS